MYNFSSIIRILLLSISLILLNLSSVKTQEEVNNYADLSYEEDLKVVDITAFVFGHINLIACSFVIYSAFMKWRTSSLSISSRVPLYLSISDICQYPFFMPNFFYSIIHLEIIPGTTCKALAYLLLLQININMILMASIAFVTYLRVVKSKTMDLGKCDWRIFAWVIISSLLLSIPSVPSLGSSKFWCLTTPNPTNLLIIVAYAVFAVTFITTCYCYYMTLSTIYNVDREEVTDSIGSTSRTDRRNKLERQATRKILLYVLIFMKWIPLLLYGVSIMLNYEEALWIDLFTIIAFNFGGICNCALYIMNEYSSNKLITYNLDIEESQHESDNPYSSQFNRSFFQHHQRVNSSTNSVTLVTSTLSNEGSIEIIDLKTFDNDEGLEEEEGNEVNDVENKGDKSKVKGDNVEVEISE